MTSTHRGPSPDGLHALEANLKLGILIKAVEHYAIFFLDPKGAVTAWNAGAHGVNGYTEQEILGRHFSALYPREDREANIPDRELVLAANNGHWSGEGWRVRGDGTRFWANVVITAVFDPPGRLAGFVGITRDESERRTAEAATHQLDLLRERERIAHELTEITIQSIFSATLPLASACTMTTDPAITERIMEAMTRLDRAISQIRSTVAALASSPPMGAQPGTMPGPTR